jgi:hypothetical protein
VTTVGGPEVIHFALLIRPDDSIATPRRVLRRVLRPSPRDEVLGPDGDWYPTDLLARVERAELPGRLEAMGQLSVEIQVEAAQAKHAKLIEVLDRQARGDLVLRMGDTARGPDGRPVAGEDLDPITREGVVSFLRRAPVALARPPRPDPFDPARTLPADIRTDGMWVWSEELAHLAESYGVAPEPQFLLHIEKRQYMVPSAVSDAVLQRAARLAGVAPVAGERVREESVPGKPPPPTREERLRALAAWHREWVDKHADSTPFRPENHPGDPSYDEHYVDIEASPEADWEFTRRASEIMGLDIETGERLDE